MYLSIFLLLIMFFLSGFDKIFNFINTSIGLQNKFQQMLLLNLPLWFFKFSIILVILLEIFAPLIIIYAEYNNKYKKYAKYSLYLLISFVIFATFLYHFPPFKSQYYPFMSNIATIGGLLILSEHFNQMEYIYQLF